MTTGRVDLNEQVDFCGHFHGAGQGYIDSVLSFLRIALFIEDGLADGGIRLPHGCSSCGKDVYVRYERRGQQRVLTATAECPFPNGLPPFSVEIDVPSGCMVFANNLLRYFPTWDDYNINMLSEQKRQTEGYAKEGLIHVTVGNTCPSVYAVKDSSGHVTKIFVGSDGAEDAQAIPGEWVGGICTDLWAFGAADAENFLTRLIQVDGRSADEIRRTLMEAEGTSVHCGLGSFYIFVEPGRYRATSTYHLVRDSDNYPKIFVSIERVGPPLRLDPIPLRMEPAEMEGEDFETTLDVMRLAWPSLFRTRALDHLFCAYGTGHNEWTPTGVIPIAGRNEAAARRRLAAGGLVSWDVCSEKLNIFTSICEYSPIAKVPDHIRPDWLKGVYEVLDLVLALDPNMEWVHTNGERKVYYYPNRANIRIAKRIKAELERRFGVSCR